MRPAGRTSDATPPGAGWPSKAARSSARSTLPDGGGAAAGAVRGTTSISPRAAAEGGVRPAPDTGAAAGNRRVTGGATPPPASRARAMCGATDNASTGSGTFVIGQDASDPRSRSRTRDGRAAPARPSSRLKAGDRVRTGDIQLGRLTLYQLSYARAFSH